MAPNSVLNQASGVIIGKVVARDIAFSLQINKATTCEDVQTVTITVVALQSASAGSTSVRVRGANMLRVGDVTTAGTIQRIDGDTVTFNTPLTKDVSAGSVVGSLRVSSYAGRGQVPNPETSSATVAGIAIASFAVAALLI